MYLCFNIFVLLFLVTPCLIVAVQPCMEWIPIKRKKKEKTNKQCFKASLRKKICFFQKLEVCFKSLKLKASFKKMETFVYIYSSFLFFWIGERIAILLFKWIICVGAWSLITFLLMHAQKNEWNFNEPQNHNLVHKSRHIFSKKGRRTNRHFCFAKSVENLGNDFKGPYFPRC